MKDLKISPLMIFLIAILAVSVLYVYFAYLPLFTKVNSINNDISDYKAEIAEIESYFGKMQTLEQDKADIQKQINAASEKLNFDGNGSAVLADINTNSQKTGVKIENVNSGNATTVAKVTTVNYNIMKTIHTVSVKGGYANISKFLKAFEENTDRYYRIESASLLPSAAAPENLSITEYSGTVKLAVYYNSKT